jgi:hypothetical protein
LINTAINNWGKPSLENEPLGQPNPRPEGLLAHARKVAMLARRATDAVNATYLLDKTEAKYIYAIEAFESQRMTREARLTREELDRFLKQSEFILNVAPILSEGSNFRRHLDQLASSQQVGRFYNGTDNVDEVVALATQRMRNPDRLHAAEEAVAAATCMLWRAGREEETVVLYNAFTEVLVNDIRSSIMKGSLYLVEARAEIVKKRLWLTGRKDEAAQLMASVSEALSRGAFSTSGERL